jgi:hypothetical protein
MSTEPDDEQRDTMQLVEGNALHPWDVWVEYVAVAGTASEEAIADYMYGKGDLTPMERERLDMALIDLLEKDWHQHPHRIFLNLAENSTLHGDKHPEA